MRCFVIMPFGDARVDAEAALQSESVFTNWIKRAVESVPDPDETGSFIQCTRADRRYTTGSVIEDIAEQLVESEIVIADLTGRNANVFYELGVRHATNVNTILIARDASDIPFDLRPLRTLFYTYEPDSMLRLQEHIRVAIGEIVRDRERIDNPVRKYLFEREARKLRKAPGLPGYDHVRDVLGELARMRREFSAELSRVQLLVKTAAGNETQRDVASLRVLTALEGVWRKDDGSGMYCARMINDQLRVAYSYDRGDDLDSHFYNMRVLGDVIVARFAWFKAEIWGYVMLHIVSNDDLVGSWWYGFDLPSHGTEDESFLTEDLPKSNPIVLRRNRRIKRFPPWAEKYFADVSLQNFRL